MSCLVGELSCSHTLTPNPRSVPPSRLVPLQAPPPPPPPPSLVIVNNPKIPIFAVAWHIFFVFVGFVLFFCRYQLAASSHILIQFSQVYWGINIVRLNFNPLNLSNYHSQIIFFCLKNVKCSDHFQNDIASG